MKNFALIVLTVAGLMACSTLNAGQFVGSGFDADQLCVAPFRCDGETIAPDNRPSLPVSQPINSGTVQGGCDQLPKGRDYLAHPTGLSCSGGGQEDYLRERLPHTQEKLDENYGYLGLGPTIEARTAAQKVLLVPNYGWTNQFKLDVRQNWVYKRKTGGYTDCRAQNLFGGEGGAIESYQTTCYRRNRKEEVVRTVIEKERYCVVASAPPPPPPPTRTEPEPETGSHSTTPSFGGGSTGGSTGHSGSSSSRPSEPRQEPRHEPKHDTNQGSSKPKGNGESFKSNRDRAKRGFDGYYRIKIPNQIDRFPSYSNRRIYPARDHLTEGSTPQYGCDRWEVREVGRHDEHVYENVEDVSYSCTKIRNQWCTWYEDQADSSVCPEARTATVTVNYKTPGDWNPLNKLYDDQLPNKFDLLLGEAELIRVSLGSNGSTLTPSVNIVNAIEGHKEPWNVYETKFSPSELLCQYKDMNTTLNVLPQKRVVQTAPNTLTVLSKSFEGLDYKGRPKNLLVSNPARNLVLDRSNLSRAFGQDKNPQAKVSKADFRTDPALKNAGISRKFWENTRFWMRLIWMDGNKKVKITLGRPFSINQAGAVGDTLNVSLVAENGMDKFYKLSVPYERFFGFLGGSVPLDPKKKYFIEIKMAQPGFDGIYLSGLNNDPSLSDEEKKLINNDAYSDSKLIPLPQVSSSRTWLERFEDWRARRMWRP